MLTRRRLFGMFGTAVGCAAGLGAWVKGLLPDTVPVKQIQYTSAEKVWVTVIKNIDLDRSIVTLNNVLMTEEEAEKLRRENEKAVYVYANGDAPFVAYDQTGYYG